MVSERYLSERHACALVELSRDTYQHAGHTSALDVKLRVTIVQAAHARRRWVYRMIHDVLRPQYPDINHNRVYRIYTAEGLSIRKRKKTRRIGVRVPLVATLTVNQPWSMDFVSDVSQAGRRVTEYQISLGGRRLKPECVDITAHFGIGGAYVTRLLDRAATFRSYPQEGRTDNGPDFTCRSFMTWAQKHGIKHILIEPGSPTQNAYIDSFNGTFRDECMDENWFESLEQARQVIAAWRADCNETRPHSSCARMLPA
jgi:putative transposase